MIRKVLGALAVAASLCGCGAELVASTAITSELQAKQLTAMKGQVQHAGAQVGRANLQKAIQTFQAEKGANPPSLEALVPDWLPALPKKADGSSYGYNPATGEVLEQAPPAASPDEQTIAAINAAIYNYGTAVGYYPPTLDALYPQYLPAPPRTASGLQFNYNNQNGAVSPPQ